MFKVSLTVVLVLLCGCQAGSRADLSAEATLSLAGQWTVKLDPEKVGFEQGWFNQTLPDSVTLPGSLVENGLGDPVNLNTRWTASIRDPQWYKKERYKKYADPDNFKFPFWLQPLKYYLGPAWYQKQIVIPEAWAGKEIVLFLERCHWETTAWLDGKCLGTQNSLSTPHRYRLGRCTPGPHTLTLCVDNTVKVDVGENAHSVSFQTQTNWNGIIGEIKLIAKDPVTIDTVQVFPNIHSKTATVRLVLTNQTAVPQDVELFIQADSFNSEVRHTPPAVCRRITLPQGQRTVEVGYSLGEGCLLWDEFSPNLYKLTAAVKTDGLSDRQTVTFGMREFKAEGTRFVVNGRRIFLRGTLECCVFPLTGYPPTDVQAWIRILTIAKAHGLNHLRFHSYCPPRAAFEAADRIGFYYQVEGPFWCAAGNGGAVDRYIRDECDRILDEYGNHPSFCLMAYGNEPKGKNQKQFLGRLVRHWKQKDPRHLYTAASGWPQIPENQFHSTPRPRIQHWGAGLASRVNSKPPQTNVDYRASVEKSSVPLVSHEIGQWCVYPNFEEIKKYTGVLRARNVEIFRDMLMENKMGDLADDFLIASGKLQTLLYKEDIESAIRTRGLGGFQLLDLHDFPGQGTALVGVLDAFWDSKGYVTADEYKRFCNAVVPLARMPKLILTSNEMFHATIEMANYGPSALEPAAVRWTITFSDGKPFAAGQFPSQTIPTGEVTTLGPIALPLAAVKKAAKLNLTVSLEAAGVENDWDFWVYPAAVAPAVPDTVRVLNCLDAAALAEFKPGARILLLPAAGTVKGDQDGPIPPGFSSIFWNTAWTRRQPPHTLGILCDPEHPALEDFPTEFHSNWQWQPLIRRSQIMILDELPPSLTPIVRVIDDWFTNRRLGLIFEAEVNGAKVLVCGIDLQKTLNARPVARQMLSSLLRYMQSDHFRPQTKFTVDSLKLLFEK